MNDEPEENIIAPRRQGFIAKALYGSPRSFFMTVATVLVLGTMISNGITRPSPSRAKNHQALIDAQKAKEAKEEAALAKTDAKPEEKSILTPDGTPDLKPEEVKPEEAKPEEAKAELAPQTKEGYEAQISTLNKRLESLETKTGDNETKSAVSEAALNEISRTQDALAGLEQKIADQEKTIAALNEELQTVAALRDKMDAMESRSSQRLASITLFGQLRDSARRGETFKPILDQLLELNKANPQANALLMQLLPVAATGLHSMEELQGQFDAALDFALERESGTGFGSNMKKLIRIRKIGEQQSGTDDESVLARAEASVNAQDLRTAIKETEALSPEGKKSMANWVRMAQEYVNTQGTIATLQLALAQPASAAEPQPVKQKPAHDELKADEKETPETAPETTEVVTKAQPKKESAEKEPAEKEPAKKEPTEKESDEKSETPAPEKAEIPATKDDKAAE